MKRLIISISFIICHLSYSSVAAQSGYGTGGGFNPDNPGIPGACGLYLDQGTVVLDGLRIYENDLFGDAVYSLWKRYCQEHNIPERDAYIGDEKYMEVMSQVTRVIICADLSEVEYGMDASDVGRYFPAMTTLDLSRTYGWRWFGTGYDEDYLQHLEVLILPDCVEQVTTMKDLHALTDVYCYAELPPAMEESGWYSNDDLFADDAEVTVHVPSSSVELYKASEAWGKYNIVDNGTKTGKIEVRMPQGSDLAQYRNMWLTLTDESTQLTTRYVVTNRKSYFFPGLSADEDISFRVALENRYGTVVCKKTDIHVGLALAVAQLADPLPVVTATVKDVDNNIGLTWYDNRGDRITSSPTLAGLVPGDVVSFDVELKGTLANSYAPLPRQTVTIPADAQGDYPIYLQLQPLSKHSFVGFLRDADSHMPLHEANVTAVRRVNGQVADTYNTLSYSDGRIIVPTYEGELTISCASKDYLRKDVVLNVTSATAETCQIGDIFLRRADGKTVSLDFCYIPAAVGAPGSSTIYIKGFEDMLVTVYNETQGERLNNVSVQLPLLILLDGVDDGDELRLDFTSASNAFDPFSVTTTMEDGHATATATITEKGGFHSTFSTTKNGSVAAIVYDSEGCYVSHHIHSTATLDVKGIDEGNYTLITMAYDPVLSQLTTLDAYEEIGLKENSDYLRHDFSVSPGILTVINLGEVPVINLDELKAVHPSSTFSISQPNIIRGDYVTVRANVKVKNEIAKDSWNYDNFCLLFDLPQGCPILNGSLMVDGEVKDPEYEGGRLKVLTNGLEEGRTVDVRFCLTCKELGKHTLNALLGFHHYDWENGSDDYLTPVGSATVEVSPMQYSISNQCLGSVVVSGTGPNDALVKMLEDETLLAETNIKGNKWKIVADLPQAYNLSTHSIHIECITKEGDIYSTPVTTVTVNRDMNTVKKVTMLYPNAYKNSTETCTWLFTEPDTKVETYDWYMFSNSYTFLIDFLRNDTTEIGDVELHVESSGGRQNTFPASFDEQRGCWVTTFLFSPPVDVAVSFTRKNQKFKADRELISQLWQDMNAQVSQENQLNAIVNSITDDNIDEKLKEAETLLGISLSDGQPNEETKQWIAWYESLPKEEAAEALQQLIEEADSKLEELEGLTSNLYATINLIGSYTLDDGTSFIVSDCSAYSESTILQQGFKAVETTDGTSIYMLVDGTRVVTVDFASGYTIEIACPSLITENNPRMARANVHAMVEKCISFLKDVVLAKIIDTYNSVFDKVANATQLMIDSYKYLEQCEFALQLTCQDENLGIVEKAKAWAKLKAVRVAKTMSKESLGRIRYISSLLGKLMIVPNYLALFQKYSKLAKNYEALDDKIPDPCPNDERAVENIRMMIDDGMSSLLVYCLGDLTINLSSDIATLLGIGFAAETMGATLAISAASCLFKTAVQWAVDNSCESDHQQRQQLIRWCIMGLECDEEEKKDPGSFGDYHIPPETPTSPEKIPLLDPSGFVCEAVESNRLEGVTATCFYKKEVEDMYGDKHEEVTVWEAENYGQVNPQLTDKDGMYSWMVPSGQWQVLYEKDGYETKRSEWLPVPPPQLDVNVGLVRRAQPALSDGHAYEKAIDVDFSLYMKSNYITKQTLTFWQDGQQLQGELKATNGEVAFSAGNSSIGGETDEEIEGPQYATSFRFVPKKNLAVGSEVTARVNGIVRSYADVPIGEDQEMKLTVGREVTSIGSDGNITVPYGGTHQVVITAKSAQAAAYRKVTITSLSPDIAQLETNRVTLDAEGKAYITVKGLLPGTTYLNFAVEGSQVKGMDTVRVVSDLDFVEAPKASIISGMYVSEGTQVELTTQPSCTIWYTLDGSCPCDETTRKRYTGPITITANTKLRAMAVDAKGNESEVVTFTWFIGTGIANVNVNVNHNNIYDLQGRKTEQSGRGIYIINGKKVLQE